MTVPSREYEADLVVHDRQDPAEGVVVLTLRHPDGTELPEWAPGAHIDVRLPGELCRQYSLCGDPGDRGSYRIAVLDEPASRGGSRYLYRAVGTRSVLGVRGPRSHFPLVPSPRYLFIAGGIGVTPILPMVAAAQEAGADWNLVYGGRSRRSMAFLDELETYGDKVVVAPEEEVGLLPLDRLLGQPQPDTLVYCCGPEGLLTAVETRCSAWPRGALHTERFAPKALTEPVLTETFEVVLRKSGMTLQVPPNRSILEVVGKAGVPTLSACQEGTCGTCETAVLEGVPDHRDSLLDEDERAANDYMMICISRSCTPRLVLDL